MENQIAYYENLIQSNPEYEYAGVYYDFAISGYKEKRPGLQKMLMDARNGKIDLIYTKSVSRFARNTAIVLKASRELKELNVGIFFELQNINTLSSQGESDAYYSGGIRTGRERERQYWGEDGISAKI